MPTPNWCFYQRSITPLLCTNEAHHLPAAAHPHGFAAQQQNRGLGAGAKWGVCMAATARQVSGVEQERWCLWSFPSARCCCANGEFCSARSHAEFALRPWGWEQPGGNRLVLPQKARGGMRGQRPPVHSAGGAVPGFTGALRAVHS